MTKILTADQAAAAAQASASSGTTFNGFANLKQPPTIVSKPLPAPLERALGINQPRTISRG